MQSMWCNPNINTYLFNTTGLQEGWTKIMQLEYGKYMQARSSHHLTAILQAGNDTEATYQYRHYDNAIHVVQRKHQHLFLQHHLVYSKVGREHMQLEYGNECRFAPSEKPDSARSVGF